jgi:hypothetical protein
MLMSKATTFDVADAYSNGISDEIVAEFLIHNIPSCKGVYLITQIPFIYILNSRPNREILFCNMTWTGWGWGVTKRSEAYELRPG